MRDRDLEAPWVGKSREEYYGYEEEAEAEFDEDFAYECRRDEELLGENKNESSID